MQTFKDDFKYLICWIVFLAKILLLISRMELQTLQHTTDFFVYNNYYLITLYS